MKHYFLACIAVFSSGFRLEAKTTTVTTYVVTTQEERESTRWTLTKWLEIKERMKLMDVWLAMFSDPKKDKFSPELMLSYGITRGEIAYAQDQIAEKTAPSEGQSGRAQLWLTNIVSSTIGVRTLNIDLGGEGYVKQTAEFTSEHPELNDQSTKVQFYTGNLRIFGKNIQDSSFVLKYGGYQAKNPLLNLEEKGEAMGGELQLYFFRWLGAEGNYMRYGKDSGTYYDYQGYIEISLFRFSAGPYVEEWETTVEGNKTRSKESGFIGNVKLSF